VPEHLRNPHRVVAAVRDGKREIATPVSLRKRALRIIQALATAAEGLGWTVQSVDESRTIWGHSWDSDDLFVINTGEPCEDIRLLQENDRSPHAPTARELAQKKSWSYTRIPEMESRIAQLPDPDVADALAWLEWCREYSHGQDPLERTIGMPADPEPTDEALRPFLR
jgi:hypothetical protein